MNSAASDNEPATRGGVIDLAALPRLLSITKAASLLGASRASAYRYAACGDLPTIRIGGRLYVVSARPLERLEAA